MDREVREFAESVVRDPTKYVRVERELFFTRPETPGELWDWVEHFLGYRIPHESVCEHHCAPFDHIELAFFEPDEHRDLLVIAHRTGGKTLQTAIIDVLEMHFKRCGEVHVGAIDSQAKKGFSYVKDFLGLDLLADSPEHVAGRKYFRPMVTNDAMSHCRLITGGNLQVMPCTRNRVNSPHEPKVTIDEAELADAEAYNEAKSIPQTDRRGNKACLRVTSTRKYAWGLVQQEVDNAPETGMTVLIWCYKETSERCPDERSGTVPVTVWVDDDTFEWYTAETYERLTEDQQTGLVRADVFEKCLECVLIPSCRGDLKRSTGWYGIDDLIHMFQRVSTEMWQAQWECRRPSSKGLIFSRFRMERHGLDDTEMARYLGIIEDDEEWDEVYAPFHPGWLRSWTKDWSSGTGGDPDVALLIQRSPDGVILVLDEFTANDMDVNQVKTYLNKNWATVYSIPAFVYCEGGGLGKQCAKVFGSRREGVDDDIPYNMVPRFFDVLTGIESIRMFLAPPGGGDPMLLVNRDRCPLTCREFQRYHEKLVNDVPTGIPADEENHTIDPIRYYIGNEIPVFRPSSRVPRPTPEQAERQRRRFPQKAQKEPMAQGFY